MRPLGVKVLGTFSIILGVIAIIGIVGGIAVMNGTRDMVPPNVDYESYISSLPGTILLGIIVAIISFIIAIAFFSGKPWGRKVIIGLSIFNIVSGVVGLLMQDYKSILRIIISAIILWYTIRPHVIAYFKGF